jgi:hypothetical protein
LKEIDFSKSHIRLVHLNELGSLFNLQVNDFINGLGPVDLKVKFQFEQRLDDDQTDEMVKVCENEKELLMSYLDVISPPENIKLGVLKGLVKQLVEEES